jgi:hypothetical protein
MDKSGKGLIEPKNKQKEKEHLGSYVGIHIHKPSVTENI